MVKKIYLHLIFLSFFLIKEAFAAESGGMPQLNPEFWVSQIFWLIISFGILFIVLSKLILPKIRNNIELRKSHVLDNIEIAEKQKIESENKLKNYEELILKSKSEAQNYFNEARKKILEEINKKKISLDEELNLEIKKAEDEVAELINKSPEKINKIAVETSSDIVKQLIGEEINKSSISAIVNDLSKKNKVKYYGN